MIFKLSHPSVIFLILISIHLTTTILKLIFVPKPATTIRGARECLHSFTPVRESDDSFFRRMWPTLHQIVDKCSAKHFKNRFVRYGSGENSIIWLPWLVDHETHKCNTVFVLDENNLSMERELKRNNPKCHVYSVSENHPEVNRFQNPEYSILTMKHKMNPKSRQINWGTDHYARDADSMDLVYFLMVQVHRPRFDSINLFYGGSDQIKLLFTKSPFDDANLSSCQFNVIYDRPKTRLQRRAFKNTWRRLLYDRRYLITNVRKLSSGNRISIFIINISEPYCWAKYVSNFPFIPKNI
ncbi:unnamed protein product [Caenorhabditis angaria]|uniref:Uncharacterized protein n=1 Tax=Caenorhabditis angaria TaxID=860376 RepID=A0A9P1IQ44_9PELO|nr:unnamed protein product [Caenorhabditis angaria]